MSSSDISSSADASEKAKKATRRLGRKRTDDPSEGTALINAGRRSKSRESEEEEDSSKQSHSTKSDNESRGLSKSGAPRLRKINETAAPPAFSDFDDPDAFGTTTADASLFPTTSDALFDNSAFASNVAFDSAFDTTNMEAMDFGSDAFGSPTQTKKKEAVVYDKAPWTKMPKIPSPPQKWTLSHRSMLTQQFLAPPVTHPITGHLLFIASSAQHGVRLHEVDAHHIPRATVPILSSDLRRMVSSKYNASVHSVYKIWTLTLGIISTARRTLVAAIVDFRILEAATTLRLVVLWQRGDEDATWVLQQVTTPPAGGDFACDLSTLQVSSTGLLLVAGASPKGACIFISQLREAWSANFLATGAGNVLAMAVSRTQPYLAVALADQTVSIWTFQAATTSTSSSKRWLFPLCQLNYREALLVEPPIAVAEGEDDAATRTKQPVEPGLCTQLVWLPVAPAFPSLMLLAVTLESGLVLFHVDLPVIPRASGGGYDRLPDPTPSTILSATPVLVPMLARSWSGQYASSHFAWVHYGPLMDLGVVVLLPDAQRARVLFGALQLPRYLQERGDDVASLRIIASTSVSHEGAMFPNGVLSSLNAGMVMLYSKQSVSSMSLTIAGSAVPRSDPFYALPVTSPPLGLSSMGDPFASDTPHDLDGVLYIVSSIQCERVRVGDVLHWSHPKRRFWLCRAVVGDTMETMVQEEKEESDFGDSYQVFGGASARILCAISPPESGSGYIPQRIVRCSGPQRVCAVVWCKAFSANIADAVSLVDYSTEIPSQEVTAGRDVAFFPTNVSSVTQGLMLSVDGASLTFFDWSAAKGFQRSTSFRPLLGINDDNGFIDCQRIASFSNDSKLSLAVIGRRHRDGRVCFVTGDVGNATDATSAGWSTLLPNLVTGRSFCFEESEEVLAVLGLQGDGSGYRNFAVSTSLRVLVLSSALYISAEALHQVTNGLAPLGSFAVCFSSNNKIRYLSCLDKPLSSGTIASIIESTRASSHNVLMCIRPDRLILNAIRPECFLVEPGQNGDVLRLSVPSTRPALVLEPMIANAVCIGGKQNRSNQTLYHVIEKFGRKVSSIAHGEREGIGTYGAGLTSGAFSILNKYGLMDAASWMLTGTANFDMSANTRLLPPWLPISPKAKGARNADSFLHLVSNGDSYFTEYIKDPNRNEAATLPRATDPIALLCREYAEQSLDSGKPFDALKMLDLSGADSTENVALLLSLYLMKQKTTTDLSIDVLKAISGFSDNGKLKRPESTRASSSLSALALLSNTNAGLLKSNENRDDQLKNLVKPLAPSLLRSKVASRPRQALIRGRVFESSHSKKAGDPLWNTPCNESKHIWNEGPIKEKEHLLLLDNLEDWLGRSRPLIFGKEGVSAIKDRGERTLADILNQDDDSFGNTNYLGSEKDSFWVEGVGEGRSDDSNLCAYFRMSEGEENDSSWRNDGFLDLSPYQNKAFIVGDPSLFSLENSTSSVDDGEAGKVKSLFDLVFIGCGQNVSSGLALTASRGGSLDIGVLHLPSHEARKKVSVEFWFYLPQAEQFVGEIVLIRRTWGPNAGNLADVAAASKRESVLWELVLHESGEIEFRTCGGSSVRTKSGNANNDDANSTDEGPELLENKNLAVFERWNHVCLVLTSKGMALSECAATIYIKGNKVASGKTMMLPPKSNVSEWSNDAKLSEALKHSHLLLGLNHCTGFRLTELRIWACERSAEDTQSFLYEYLTAAEQKKKLKVKITSKNKIGPVLGKGTKLIPPKKGLSGLSNYESQVGLSLAPSDIESAAFSLKPPKPKMEVVSKPEPTISKRETILPKANEEVNVDVAKYEVAVDEKELEKVDPSETRDADDAPSTPDVDVALTLWDSAVPLSQQLRPSAAAALIRGPPATRHYGGNRGGLPDFSGADRFGVGGIAICGSEKTIVFRDNEDPPAVTYPIGASGAVVSDQMDDDGSEFLCCFLAKEGRMVVFELRSRTVVVELQMTTKLNFWRYLPPEAADNSLCYMLVTPVGGFHWKPLEDSPRPHQVWKRGSELQGKKVVNYEEGGSNGGDGDDISSRVGLITVTRSSTGGSLEGWLLPIAGDSQALPVPFDLLGACLCQPLNIEDGQAFLPMLVTVSFQDNILSVNVISIVDSKNGSLALGEVVANQVVEEYDMNNVDFEPPALAMGPFPEAICVSLSNIIVVVMRRKGFVAAFEYEGDELNIIAIESVDHFVIDSVMRYSPDVGGAEIVMLLSDINNPKDGRIVSFCFRSAV